MYGVSDAYKTAIEKTSRVDKIIGTITLTDNAVIQITDADLKGGTLTLDNQCVNGDELIFGAVYAAQASFTITSGIDRYKFFNARVDLSYSVKLADGSFEAVPLGVFYITEPTRTGKDVSIKALDNMIKLSGTYDGTSVYGTPWDVLSWISTQTGVSLANTAAEIGAMPNGATIIQLDGSCNCSTFRDAVAEVARLLAGFATMTRTGTLLIRQFGTTSVQTIPADQRFSTSISDFVSSYMGVKFAQSTETLESYDPGKTTGLIMEADGIPFLNTISIPETKQAIVDAIRGTLCALSYTPMTVSFVGNPALDLGDVVTCLASGAPVTSIITTIAWKYRGAETIKCVGKNPYFVNQKNSDAKRLKTVENQIETTATAVATFENIRPITLTTDLKQIIKLFFVTNKKTSAVFSASILLTINTDAPEKVNKTTYTLTTDAQGVATLNEVVTEESVIAAQDQTITFQYQLNSSDNLSFLPTQTIRTGKYIATLIYPIAELGANAVNDFRVFAKTSGGTIEIGASQIKAAIYGAGLKAANAVWDGTLTFEEALKPVALAGMSVNVPVVTLTVVPQTAGGKSLSEVISPVALGGMTIGSIMASMSFGTVTEREYISPAKIASYTFNQSFVQLLNNAIRLKTEFEYSSLEQTTTAGRMLKLPIITSNLSSVTGIGVK